ncbi:MAG: acetate/propionate family kinase [Candidatus Paceibacterota bacterium]|jgi:acetate kinase
MNINDQILVLNSGSTSLKYKLFDFKLKELNSGFIEDIGKGEIKNHTEALKEAIGKIGNVENIKYVGHRVVHGGGKYSEPILVNPEILKEIEKVSHLAPLHNPANLEGIRASMEIIGGAQNVAVFDTAFYRDLPEYAYLYAIPRRMFEKYGIRRYGFHGISHNYIMLEAAKQLGKPAKRLNLITCHLGGGASITAIRKGRAIDTSMGFTPMEGLPMASRCGDLDPGVILELIKNTDIEIKDYTGKGRAFDVDYLLNRESGLKGLAETENDSIYEISHNAKLGNEKMISTLQIYAYRIRKYIGAYKAILGDVDAIVFSGTVGFRSTQIKKMILVGYKDIKDIKKLVIKTDEELMIAKEIIKMSK